MHEPAVALPINPQERPFVRAGDEVVALRLVAVPPAAFDALGPGKQLELQPRKAPRRLEQPERTRAGRPEFARIPFARLHPPPGEFRPVVGLGGETVDRSGAEAAPQALEELRPVFAVGLRVAEHAAGTLVQRLELR